MKELPIYKLTLEDDLDAGLSFISLVKDPAIGIKGLAFANEPIFEFKFNDEKQIIAGPAIVPDKLIYRNSPDMGEFYVVFTKEDIQKFVAKFNKSNKTYKVNMDHESIIPDAYIAANWIIESTEFDKSKYYGFENLPEGTWFVEIHVEDSEVWKNEIKTKGKNGFSVEGMFGMELKFNKNKNNNMNKLKFAKEELADGTTIYVEGPLEVGAAVVVLDQDLMKVPVFDGEHLLVDGKTIVTVDGKITEIKPKAEEMAEEAPVTEEMAEEVIEDVVDAPVEPVIAAIDEAKILEIIQPKLDELYTAIAELKTLLEQESIEEETEIDMTAQKFNSNEILSGYLGFVKRNK
jgi:hypothetical protein